MNGQNRRIELHDRAHGPGHRIGYVVEFEINEQGHIALADFFDTFGSVGAEEFQTQLEAADRVFQRIDQSGGFIHIAGIERTK
ncbi:hypothetical protein JCM17843_05000 [Kordiimonadales bacterium JCM 17843]|nr:hypothetical protein JCM17843_05000 [Kordiimonadales bacterium JCM 17843]